MAPVGGRNDTARYGLPYLTPATGRRHGRFHRVRKPRQPGDPIWHGWEAAYAGFLFRCYSRAFLGAPLVGWSARFMIVMCIVVTVFRTCEVGPSADRRGRRRGRLIGSLAVTAPAHSCSTRTCGVIRRATIPQGNGTAARALFGWLMHHGNAIII